MKDILQIFCLFIQFRLTWFKRDRCFVDKERKVFFISCGYSTLGSGHLLSFHSIRLHNYCVSCVTFAVSTSAASFWFRLCAGLTDLPDLGASSSLQCLKFVSLSFFSVLLFFNYLYLGMFFNWSRLYITDVFSYLFGRSQPPCSPSSCLTRLYILAAECEYHTPMPSTRACLDTIHQAPTHRTPTHLCARPCPTLTFIIAAVPRCKQTHKVRRHRPRLQHRLTVYDKDLLTQSERYCVSPCRPLHHHNMLLIIPQMLKLCIHRL